ncbi:DUF4271 domain-containing protein [Marivirga lumbricoides]|uniref:DUF4271 domain-containing protein n=1 Tax=Marivirga lumbricoides TaxID=1046115 RepID=UPI0016679CD4
MNKYLIIIIFSSFISWPGNSQSPSGVFSLFAEEDSGQFRLEWLEKHSLNLDEDKYVIGLSTHKQENSRLYIHSDEEFYIFDNSALIGKSSNNNVIDVALDSLKRVYTSDSITILLNPKAENLHYGVYHKIKGKIATVASLNITPKESDNHLNNIFMILLLLFSVLLVSLKLSFSKRFVDVFSVSRNFSFRPYEGDNLRVRLFDQDGIFLSILYTFATAIIIYLYFQPADTNYNISDNIDVVSRFLRYWGAIVILLVLKLLLIFTMSLLYRSGRINTFYIKEMLNISTLLITLLIIFTAIVYLFNGFLPEIWWSLVRNILVLFYIIRVFLVYFKILKLSGFTNVYLFSYFCTTEIFPFVIGLKYFY